MKIHIASNGCAILRHETYRISKFFGLNNHEEVKDPQLADIIVFTGCGVTEEGELEALSIIDSLIAKAQPSVKFVVAGCLPKIAKEQILAHVPNAILIGYEESYKFNELVDATTKLEDVCYNYGHPFKYFYDEEVFEDDAELLAVQKMDKLLGTDIIERQYNYTTPRHYLWKESDVFQIRVAYGCGGNCSFCATKLAIGSFRSVPQENLYEQFREGLKAGFKRFVLVGDEIGFYGIDINFDFASFIDGLYAIAPDVEIAIRYIYPDMLVKYYPRLKKYFQTGYIFYFCSAIQSASPRILRMMNRNPNIGDFVECIKDIRKNNYPVVMHSQIIVGFPSESDEDFLMTLKCLMDCDFDYFNVNMFSMRSNTKACIYRDLQVDNDIIKRRWELMKSYLRLCQKSRLFDTIRHHVINKQ